MKTQITTLTYKELDLIQKNTIDHKLYGFGLKKSFKDSLIIELGKELRNGQKEILSIKTPKGKLIK